MQRSWTFCGVLLLFLAVRPGATLAWDYAGHRLINQAALKSLPTNFPAFVFTPTARERIAFLGGEADRWRNTPDLTFRHRNGPDHFLDVDDLPLYHLEPAQLSPFRYDFVAQLARGRDLHATNFPPVDPKRDMDHTRALIGFLPWTISEYYSQLKSAFSYLKSFEDAGGSPDELANARENVIFLMGVMGHFVGDVTQPLHTTKHYNGWVGANPNGYTAGRGFHAWIDGGCLEKVGLTAESLTNLTASARNLALAEYPGVQTNIFPLVMKCLLEQSSSVEPLYRLEKEGALTIGRQPTDPGTAFLASQLHKAARMLGDLWVTAWQEAPPDKFLTDDLKKRAKANGTPDAAPQK